MECDWSCNRISEINPDFNKFVFPRKKKKIQAISPLIKSMHPKDYWRLLLSVNELYDLLCFSTYPGSVKVILFFQMDVHLDGEPWLETGSQETNYHKELHHKPFKSKNTNWFFRPQFRSKEAVTSVWLRLKFTISQELEILWLLQEILRKNPWATHIHTMGNR